MTPQPQPDARFITRCLFCTQTFKVPNLAIPAKDATTEQRAVLIVMALAEHVKKKHKAEYAKVEAAARDMYGLRIAALFAHEDPVFRTLVEKIREALR